MASIFGLHRPDYRNSRVFSGKSELRHMGRHLAWRAPYAVAIKVFAACKVNLQHIMY